MKTNFFFIASTIFVFLLVSCHVTDKQNENLPDGMKSGYWENSEDHGLFFFDNGYVTNHDGYIGTYVLLDDNSILIQHPFVGGIVTISAINSERQIVADMSTEGDYEVYNLLMPQTSSGNIQKEIIGIWEEHEELHSLDEAGDGFLWEFRKDGTLIITDEASGIELEAGNYRIIEDKLKLEFGRGEEWTPSVFSLGDLIFLADFEEQNGLYLLRKQK